VCCWCRLEMLRVGMLDKKKKKGRGRWEEKELLKKFPRGRQLSVEPIVGVFTPVRWLR
jgi:hypothetical protein